MELTTKRLRLHPYRQTDIRSLAAMLNSRQIAANTLRLPYPYSERDAREFLSRQESPASKLGMFEVSTGKLVGGIGLTLEESHRRAELGYWVGVRYWGHGYATEAAAEVVRHAFEDLKLNRVFAYVFSGNTASEKVLQKVGLKHEGTLRQHVLKWDKFLDEECYGIVAADWRAHGL